MLILYLDEFGHAGAWDPSDHRHCHHPLFGLGGIAVECARARDLDRGYFRLKERYYKHEDASAWKDRGKRAERFEPKQLRDRRDRRFATEVLYLVRELRGCIVAYGCAKVIGIRRHDETALYNKTMQGALRNFDGVIAASGAATGIIVADRRSEPSDMLLLASAQSYLYSKPTVRRVAETPFLVRSDWHHGVQAADTIGRVLAAVHRYRADGDLTYQPLERTFGPLLDTLTMPIGRFRESVFIRRRQKLLAPSAVTAPTRTSA
jgi:hypothetical protein